MPIKIHFSVLINFQHFIPSSMSALFYFPVCMSAWYDWGNSSQPQCLRTTQPKDSCKSFSKRAEMFSVRFPTSFCQVKSSKSWIQNSKIIALFSHIGLCKPLHIFWNIISPQMIGYDMSTLRTWLTKGLFVSNFFSRAKSDLKIVFSNGHISMWGKSQWFLANTFWFWRQAAMSWWIFLRELRFKWAVRTAQK